MTRGRLPQRAGSLGLNGSGAAAVVPRLNIQRLAVEYRDWLEVGYTAGEDEVWFKTEALHQT